jgi:hypothetical protein
MAPHEWSDAPAEVRAQVERLVVLVRAHVGDDLVGIYLHGSLAMGSFLPVGSDVNLLAVSERPMSLSTKWRVVQVLLRLSGAPSPIEIWFFHRRQLRPWSHPTPFDLLFGEARRELYESDLASGGWKDWNRRAERDGNIARHVKLARERGVCLWGAPIDETLPDVPAEDYVASLLANLAWARGRPGVTLDDRLLNLARAWAYLETGAVMSKDESGAWALGELPARHASAVEAALAPYRGGAEAPIPDDESMLEAAEDLERRVGELASMRAGARRASAGAPPEIGRE